MLQFLDSFLTVFHSALVFFILTGWLFAKTRKIHFWTLAITLTAWLVIGYWIGTIGYCPITDWHWDLKRSLGQRQLPGSFIKYMIDQLLGIDANREMVDIITGIGMAAATIAAVIMRIRGRRRGKKTITV
ncbi:MAG: hypothetical protein ACJASO_000937 [Cyclobacteriaceae bacterium]|jgi:hypothetical protein